MAPKRPLPKQGAAAPAASKPAAEKAQSSDAPSAGLILMKMILVAIGIYSCFFAWGVMHEKVATHDYFVDGKKAKFKYHLVTCLIGACCTIVVSGLCMAGLALIGRPVKRVKVPLRNFLVVGTTMTFAAPMGLTAAKQLSYPVYLTVKMCKMVPTVIVGALWHRFKYSPAKLAATVFITAGVLGFSLLSDKGDSQAAANSPGSTDAPWTAPSITTVVAVALCFVAMTLDGYTNSTQDAIIKQHNGMHPMQLMLGFAMSVVVVCTATLGVAELLPPALHTELVKPELAQAASFVVQDPNALQDVVVLGLLNALGQVFIYTGLGIFGSLTVMAIGTTRKIGSVFISIAVHGHSVTTEQWFALIAVVAGVVCDAWDSVTSKKKHHKH